MFACTKFHQYLYGQTITVQTDHKPLVTLFSKPLHSVPVRLQRMMLKLQSYDLKLTFIPGKLLIIADTLSRAALDITEVDEIEGEIILHVQNVVQNLAISKNELNVIKKKTLNNPVFKKIIKIIENGWPDNKKLINDSLKPYWSFKEEL